MTLPLTSLYARRKRKKTEKSSEITWYTKKCMKARMGPVRFLWMDLRRRLGGGFLVSRSEDEVGSDGRNGFMSSSRCCEVNCFP